MTQSAREKAWQKAYDATPEQKKKRAATNKARRMMEAEGKAHKGDGKDVGHIKALANGGKTTPSNIRVQSRASNRGWRKGSSSYNPDK